MSLPAEVLSKKNRAGAKAADVAITGLNFHFTGQIHHELASRSIMPIDEVFATAGFPEDYSLCRDQVRHGGSVIRRLHLLINVLKVRLTLGIGVDARIFHQTDLRSYA